MKKYLYAVQDENGREILSAEVETDQVSEVTAKAIKDEVVLRVKSEEVARAAFSADQKLQIHRWPADDKLSEPVSKKIVVSTK
jgi:hypothetical protein